MNIGIYRDNFLPTKQKKQRLCWVKYLVIRFHSQAPVQWHYEGP